MEEYLAACGVPGEAVERVVSQAVAWRVTPGGRALIDRRRQLRVQRNVRLVAEHLRRECGVPLGARLVVWGVPREGARGEMRTAAACLPRQPSRPGARAQQLGSGLLWVGWGWGSARLLRSPTDTVFA